MLLLRFVVALALVSVAAPAAARGQQSAVPRQSERIQGPSSSLDRFFGRASVLPGVADTAASRALASTCPMPIARPDTAKLERMPRVRVDSAKMAPMPVARGCVAEAR